MSEFTEVDAAAAMKELAEAQTGRHDLDIPMFTFSGDTNTGFYFADTSNTLTFNTNGINQLNITCQK